MRNIEAGQGVLDAVRDALRRRGESYSREQECTLIADRHPQASIAANSVKRAFDEGAPIAATQILDGQRASKASGRVRLNENLLVQPASGASP